MGEQISDNFFMNSMSDLRKDHLLLRRESLNNLIKQAERIILIDFAQTNRSFP